MGLRARNKREMKKVIKIIAKMFKELLSDIDKKKR
jgi:hypothetical protein